MSNINRGVLVATVLIAGIGGFYVQHRVDQYYKAQLEAYVKLVVDEEERQERLRLDWLKRLEESEIESDVDPSLRPNKGSPSMSE